MLKKSSGIRATFIMRSRIVNDATVDERRDTLFNNLLGLPIGRWYG